MTASQSFTVATYSVDGIFLSNATTEVTNLDEARIAHFSERLKLLSGDLELPFEDKLPGEIEFLDFRIGSDKNGAYLLYYFHDEVIFASLMLSGTDVEQESELLQVFKFLLLDSGEEEEPTEEEIDAILGMDEFDFSAIAERPALFQIKLSEIPDEEDACQHVQECDQHLAAAFFAMEREA